MQQVKKLNNWIIIRKLHLKKQISRVEMLYASEPSSHCWSQTFRSVTQSFSTICGPMDCSTGGYPVYHQLPELTQTDVHWVGDATKPSQPLMSPSPPAFNSFQQQSLFQWVSSSHQVAKMSFSFSVTPSTEYSGLFHLGWSGWISLQSKGLSRVFSNTQFKSINSLELSFLYSPTLTSIHDYWKNHSFD